MSDHKRVKDIVTTGVSEAEYRRIYREGSTAGRIAAAQYMGVLDEKWAREVYEALRNPQVRRASCVCVLSLFMSFVGFLISYALLRAL